jgi:hypothetical protein
MMKINKFKIGNILKFIVAVGSLVVSTFFVQSCI